MRRQSISAIKYAAILGELAVTATHKNAMCVTIGSHDTYGRVVLLRSSTSFVMIADCLEGLRENYDENQILRAVAHWAEATANMQDHSL